MKKSARNIFREYLENDLAVSYETMDQFDAYHTLLSKWQNHINLTSGNDDIWLRHFLDSAQLAKQIENKKSSVIDLGSGAGFPGLALAILGYTNVTLVDSDKKKNIFLKEVARTTKTDVKILGDRIEKIEPAHYDYVISRACAPLELLIQYGIRFVSHGTICLFLKGKNYAMELDDAKKIWSFDCQIIPSITHSDGAILSITNLTK